MVSRSRWYCGHGLVEERGIIASLPYFFAFSIPAWKEFQYDFAWCCRALSPPIFCLYLFGATLWQENTNQYLLVLKKLILWTLSQVTCDHPFHPVVEAFRLLTVHKIQGRLASLGKLLVSLLLFRFIS